MTSRCPYCFLWVLDEAAHILSEHELHLTPQNVPFRPTRPLSACPTCFRLTTNVQSHHQNTHVESVRIHTHSGLHVFYRSRNNVFDCPWCSSQFRSPIRFSVSLGQYYDSNIEV